MADKWDEAAAWEALGNPKEHSGAQDYASAPEGIDSESEAHRSGFNVGEAAQQFGNEMVKSYGMRYEKGQWSWSVENIGKAWDESPFWTTVDYLTLAVPVAKWGLAARAVTKEASLAGRAFKAGESFREIELGRRGRAARALGVSDRFAKATEFQMKHGSPSTRFGEAFSSRVAERADANYLSRYHREYGVDRGDLRGISALAEREASAQKVVLGRVASRLQAMAPKGVEGERFTNALKLGDTGVVLAVPGEAFDKLKRLDRAEYGQLARHSFSQAAGSAAGRAEKKILAKRGVIEGTLGNASKTEKYRISEANMAAYKQTFAFRQTLHEGLYDAGLISEHTYKRNLEKYFPRMYRQFYGANAVVTPGARRGSTGILEGQRGHLLNRVLTDEQVALVEKSGHLDTILDPASGIGEIARAGMNLTGHNYFMSLMNSRAVVGANELMFKTREMLYNPNPDLMTKAWKAQYSPRQLDRLKDRFELAEALKGTKGPNGAIHRGLTLELQKKFVEEELGWRTVRDAMKGAPSKYLARLPEDLLDKHIDPAIMDDVRGLADVATHIEGLPGALKDVWDAGLTTFKYGKTILNPATQARNAVGAMIFHHMTVGGAGIFSKKSWFFKAGREALTAGKGQDYEDLLSVGILDSSFSREFANYIKDKFALGGGSGMGSKFEDLLKNFTAHSGKFAQEAAARAGAAGRSVAEYAEDTYRYVDEVAKADAFIVRRDAWLKKLTAHPPPSLSTTNGIRNEALARAFSDVAKYQPMFSHGSEVSNALRTVVPFASFTTESARIWKNVITDKPHIAFFWNHAVEGLSEISAGISGVSEDDMEAARASMPGYQQGKKMALLPFQVQGKPMFLDMSYMIPMANIGGIDTAKQNFFDYAQVNPITSNPWIALGSAVQSGNNPFTGQEIEPSFSEDQLGATIRGDGARKAVGLLEYTASMMLPPLVPPGQAGVNLLEMMRGTKNKEGFDLEQGVIRTAMANIAGMRLYEADTKSQIMNVRRDNQMLEERMATRWNRLTKAWANGDLKRAHEEEGSIRELRNQAGYPEDETDDYIANGLRKRQPGEFRGLTKKQREEILKRSATLEYTDAEDRRVISALQGQRADTMEKAAKARRSSRKRGRKKREKKPFTPPWR